MHKMKWLPFALIMMACAHGKLGTVSKKLDKGSIKSDQTIYVLPVNVESAHFSGDKSADQVRVGEIKATLHARYGREIAEQLRHKGFRAEAVDKAPRSGVVLSGKVTRVENGSAAARIFVGMGAGSANLYTDFQLLLPNGEILSEFEIIATSGGNGGLQASGSYLKAHIQDGAEKTAQYISESNSGKK